MPETRVNLKRTLENRRDQYPFSLGEAIVRELVDNALDAKPNKISFELTFKRTLSLSIADDGRGMDAEQLEQYHDLSESPKIKGESIGFAGEGAKLALLTAGAVTTETRQKEFHKATLWYLEDDYKAPWDYVDIDPEPLVHTPAGTAVRLEELPTNSPLLQPQFVEEILHRAYEPLLDPYFAPIVTSLYGHPVEFYVQGKIMPAIFRNLKPIHLFEVFVRARRRKSGNENGAGFVGLSEDKLPEEERGIAISIRGKLIKRGWDWLDLAVEPSFRYRIQGIVEVPDLAKLLTTTKTDFRRSGSDSATYYSYRKAMQEALLPKLKSLGAVASSLPSPQAPPERLQREIEAILKTMADDWPNIQYLFTARQKGDAVTGGHPNGTEVGKSVQGTDPMTGTRGGSGVGGGTPWAPGKGPDNHFETGGGSDLGQSHTGRRRLPSVRIGFIDELGGELGRLSEGTIWINQAHPAYLRAAKGKSSNYHTGITACWVLLKEVDADRRPEFMANFLGLWGKL